MICISLLFIAGASTARPRYPDIASEQKQNAGAAQHVERGC